jgi:hypothetical protein
VPESRGSRNRAIGHMERGYAIVDDSGRTAPWELLLHARY